MRIYELQARILALNKRLKKDKQVSTNFINISLSHITHVHESNNPTGIHLSRPESKRQVSKIQRLHKGIIQDKRRRVEGQRSLYSSCSTWIPRDGKETQEGGFYPGSWQDRSEFIRE